MRSNQKTLAFCVSEPANRSGIAQKRGKLFVVSAPSGAGKSTLCKLLIARRPLLSFSVSFTTRAPRAGEKDGVEYRFVEESVFLRMAEGGEFLEYASVHGNYYGTSKKTVEINLGQGRDILLEIDVQGAMQLKNLIDYGVYVFITPPSLEELKFRLTSRGDTALEEVELRLKNAAKEMEHKDRYDYIIVNDDLNEAYKRLERVYDAVSGH